MTLRGWRTFGVVSIAAACVGVFGIQPSHANTDLVKKGQYMVWAGGCIGCHTDTKGKKPELAGGHALKTPFGVFLL